MSIKITLDYSTYSAGSWTRVTGAVIYNSAEPDDPNTVGRRILKEDLPRLTQNIERGLCEFGMGDLTFTAENDTGFWSPGWATGPFGRPDPYCDWWHGAANQKPVQLSIYKDSYLRWSGTVDLDSVQIDLKANTATFTVRGPLSLLEGYNAEDIRRAIPRYGWTAVATAIGTVSAGSSYYIEDSEAVGTTDRFNGQALLKEDGTCYLITDTATVSGVLRITFAAGSQPFSANDPFTVSRLHCISAYTYGDAVTVGVGSITDDYEHVSWTSDEWVGYFVLDSLDHIYGPITTNDAHVISCGSPINDDWSDTPAVGRFWVIGASEHRLLEFQQPNDSMENPPNRSDWHWTPVGMGLVPGDKLVISPVWSTVTADTEPSNTWAHKSWTYGTQEVVIQSCPIEDGTATSCGVNVTGYVEVTGETWTTDEWIGYYLCDSTGTMFPVASNTSTRIYWTDANSPDAADKDFTILPLGSPPLGRGQVWLSAALTHPVQWGDAVSCSTPYYRGLTVSELVQLFATATGSTTSSAWKIVVTTDHVVPYADFEGKSALDALTELAVFSNSALYAGYVAGQLWFYFARRDQSTRPTRNITDYLTEATQRLTWEQSYQAIMVTGAEGHSVYRGAYRYGGRILEVSTDYAEDYSTLKAVANQLFAFFCQQRGSATVKLLGEFAADDVISFDGDALYTKPTGWSEYAGDIDLDWQVIPAYGTVVTSPALAVNANSSSHNCIISCDDVGYSTSADITVDLCFDEIGHPQGIMFHGADSKATWLAAVATGGAPGSVKIMDQDGVTKVTANKTLSVDTWYTLRVAWLMGWTRVWIIAKGGTYGTPDLNYMNTASPIWNIINIGLYGYYHEAGSNYYVFDNFAWRQGGINLGDCVTTTGSDSWLVTGISESLEDPPDEIELQLVGTSGTAFTPTDDDTVAIDAMPEPPVIWSVSAGVGSTDKIAGITWSGPKTDIAFMVVQVWAAKDPRPSTGQLAASFEKLYNTYEYMKLEYYQGVYPGAWYLYFDAALFISGVVSGDYLVDVAAVLHDGRMSDPSDAYAFVVS